MKIKLDFITNSSSTIYVIAVPKDFVLNIPEFLSNYDDEINPEPLKEDTNEYIINEANKALEDLKKGVPVWLEDINGGTFWGLMNALEDNILAGIDAADGYYHFQPITQDQIEIWLAKNTIDKIYLGKGEHVTETEKQ